MQCKDSWKERCFWSLALSKFSVRLDNFQNPVSLSDKFSCIVRRQSVHMGNTMSCTCHIGHIQVKQISISQLRLEVWPVRQNSQAKVIEVSKLQPRWAEVIEPLFSRVCLSFGHLVPDCFRHLVPPLGAIQHLQLLLDKGSECLFQLEQLGIRGSHSVFGDLKVWVGVGNVLVRQFYRPSCDEILCLVEVKTTEEWRVDVFTESSILNIPKFSNFYCAFDCCDSGKIRCLVRIDYSDWDCRRIKEARLIFDSQDWRFRFNHEERPRAMENWTSASLYNVEPSYDSDMLPRAALQQFALQTPFASYAILLVRCKSAYTIVSFLVCSSGRLLRANYRPLLARSLGAVHPRRLRPTRTCGTMR